MRDRLAAIGIRLGLVFRRRDTWLGLLFAALAGAGFEGVGAVAGPFLVDRGFATEDIGVFFALNSVMAMIAGAVTGGYIADRIGKRAAVSGSLVLLSAAVFAVAGYDALARGGGGPGLLAALTVLYLCIGLFTASSYALFMEITDPSLGATQFSAFMAATNACESWSGFAVGRGIPVLGYSGAFSILALVSLATFPLVRRMSARDGTRPGADMSPRQ